MEKELLRCLSDGDLIDMQRIVDRFRLDFSKMTSHNLNFLRSECREQLDVIEESAKVGCYRTYRLTTCGFSDTVYFKLDEKDIMDSLATESIKGGWYGFTIEKVSIPQMKLDGFMKERNEWHKEWA